VLPAYEGTDPWRAPLGPVPPYPAASNLAPYAVAVNGSPSAAPTGEVSELREELRRIILEELTTIIRG
jgi:hypothetical protein